MFSDLKDLFKLLHPNQKRKFYLLQILVIFMSCAELISIISIAPFMAIVGDVSSLQQPGLLMDIYTLSGIEDVNSFLVFLAIIIILILSSSSILSMYTIWKLSMYAAEVGADLSSRLYTYYLSRPWLFHAQSNSTQLTNKIAQECERVTSGIITPLMQMNAKIILVFIMSTAIFIYSPAVAVFAISIFGLAYFVMYKSVRKHFTDNGEAISSEQALRFKYMGEGFGGIKDLLLYGRQSYFISKFRLASNNFANAKGMTQTLSQVPRYAIELLAFAGVILLMVYLILRYDGNLGSVLPLLSIFVLAGLKLLPAFQQIYFSVSQVRANLSALNSIRDDLFHSLHTNIVTQEIEHLTQRQHKKNSLISVKDLSFSYPESDASALQNITLEIQKNQIIGVVGSSGSGKSSLIDILMGLIEPTSGQVLIDGVSLCKDNIRSWQNNLGFVSQNIFLSDGSIKENLAFGIPHEEIDDLKVINACKMAHLEGLIEQLPDGLLTRVGERGVQLSGGQRQRIGIGRALYNDADILFFDEATSALDGITEKFIMDSINDFRGKKTIILIAHRLATVKKCNIIYILENGRILDQGSFDELSERNSFFQEMLNHA